MTDYVSPDRPDCTCYGGTYERDCPDKHHAKLARAATPRYARPNPRCADCDHVIVTADNGATWWHNLYALDNTHRARLREGAS